MNVLLLHEAGIAKSYSLVQVKGLYFVQPIRSWHRSYLHIPVDGCRKHRPTVIIHMLSQQVHPPWGRNQPLGFGNHLQCQRSILLNNFVFSFAR